MNIKRVYDRNCARDNKQRKKHEREEKFKTQRQSPIYERKVVLSEVRNSHRCPGWRCCHSSIQPGIILIFLRFLFGKMQLLFVNRRDDRVSIFPQKSRSLEIEQIGYLSLRKVLWFCLPRLSNLYAAWIEIALKKCLG